MIATMTRKTIEAAQRTSAMTAILVADWTRGQPTTRCLGRVIEDLSRSDRRCPHAIQSSRQLIHFRWREKALWPPRRYIREWRLVEQSGAHDTVLSQVIRDQIDELDL